MAKVRAEFQEKISERLKALDEKLADLRTRAQNLSGDERVEFDETVTDFSARRAELDENVSELRSSASERWEEFKSDVSRALDELERDIEDMLD